MAEAVATVGRKEIAMALSQGIAYIYGAISDNIHCPIRPKLLLVGYGLLGDVRHGLVSILQECRAPIVDVIEPSHDVVVSLIYALIAKHYPTSLQLHLYAAILRS
jgi:hypothetical protein